jgi:hypothetical protein
LKSGTAALAFAWSMSFEGCDHGVNISTCLCRGKRNVGRFREIQYIGFVHPPPVRCIEPFFAFQDLCSQTLRTLKTRRFKMD